MAASQNAVKKGFKDIGLYSVLLVGSLMAMMVSAIIVGYFDEKILAYIGLNESGAAATFIASIVTIIFTSLTAISGIASIGSGLAILQIIMEMFGFKIKFGSKKENDY